MTLSLRAVFSFVLALAAIQATRPGPVPLPKVSEPIPVTADSFPFLAASRNLEPFDLARYGYLEEERIVNGTANVYDWAADGALAIRASNAPYATRILARYPADPARFSGTVVVELLHAGRRYDWAMMWGYSRDYFVEHGDAWVGVTLPGAIDGLKRFDPARYAALSFANPAPDVPCPGGGANALSVLEEGLRWDAISQIGALIKSNMSSRPMARLRIGRVFMTMQSADVMTYINAIHPRAVLESGKPVYDGFLVKSPLGVARINRCAPAIDRDDARQKIRNVNVPVITVLAQGEVVEAYPLRRADGDAAGDRFRSYEVAGASHIDRFPYRGLPSMEEQGRAGNAQGTAAWPFAQKCNPEIPLTELPVMSYAFNAAFRHLDAWARGDATPPRAAPVMIEQAGTANAAVALDDAGNGKGGVRSPYVDVPAATFRTSSPGPGTCREMGHETPFDAAGMAARYGSRESYISRVEQSVDRLVKEGWFNESDGRRMKDAARAAK
ncbi:MAG TPA: alpha/beta hydrolase domain-containing protein [Terriglobia bacterium]|nr:alpha/beta hydrolase domain-containing protein [Terriglobia bacterium]